ncbi:MAG: MucR family transcriptional regulator [Pseudomonadota bacterium]
MTDNKSVLDHGDAIMLASEIVTAYVSNNKVASDDLPELLHNIYGAVSGLADDGVMYSSSREPAVPISKSVTPDFVICLEDGKKLKMLKRYLRTHYDLSPDEYRRKWGLPADYPMVAPNYAKRRSQVAKEFGLGTSATKKRKTTKRKTTKKRATRKKR